MKSVLKRRKHRKGIRPVRKGTLKVRMVTLPTRDEHDNRVDELMGVVSKALRDPKFKPHPNMTYSELWANQRHSAMMNVLLDKIGLMQKGYDYFREYGQIDPAYLSLQVISQGGPVFQEPEQTKDACALCYLKNKCPFAAYSKTQLDLVCPTKRREYLNEVKRVLNEKELTVTEMANAALTHLS